MKKILYIKKYFNDWREFNKLKKKSKNRKKNNEMEEMIFISHGGGEINGIPYTNSLETIVKTLEVNFKFIEIDLRLTVDKKIVLVHDYPFLNNILENNSYTEDFNILAKKMREKFKLTLLEFDSFIKVIENYEKSNGKEVNIILDYTWKDTIEILEIIEKTYPDYIIKKIIPQITKIDHYFYLKNKKFQKPIFNIGFYENNKYLLRIIELLDITAISISNYNFFRSEIYLKLKRGEFEKNIFIHTINNFNEVEFLKKIGIKGIYTDLKLGE